MSSPILWALDAAQRTIDRLVPKGPAVVMRTYPDYDDQAREIGRELVSRGVPVTLLVDDLRPPVPPLDFPCRILGSRTPAAVWAFLRAPVVLHTHGVYANLMASRRTRFVNLWHGMPIKRLPAGARVATNQTDVTLATSDVHARNLSETWGLAPDRVVTAGLPRNDVLRRPASERARAALAQLGLTHPLVVWLPTFRTSISKLGERDGTDLGTPTQFEGADLEVVDDLMAELGLSLIIEPHPLAPAPEPVALARTRVWSSDDLRASGMTLYELLAASDLLITDVSSVWIDYLLLDRPIVFAMSDLPSYRSSRGLYFDSVEELLPGPIATTWSQLAGLLRERAACTPEWTARRRNATSFHHEPLERPSAEAVADLVVTMLGAVSKASGGAGSDLAKRLSAGVFDQVLSSASNFLALLVAARLLTTDRLGSFSLAMATYTVALGATRALCSEALLVRIGDDDVERRERAGRALTDSFAIGVVALGPLLIVAMLSGGDTRRCFVVLAATLPFLLVQDTMRYGTFARGWPRLALISDGLWVVVQLIAYAICAALDLRTAPILFGIWAFAGVAGGIVLVVTADVPVRLHRSLSWIRGNIDLGGRYLTDFVAGVGVGQIAYYVVAGFVSVGAVGALRGAQTLYGAVNVLVAGSYIVLVPEAQRVARESTRQLQRFCVVSGGVLGAIGALQMVALWALTPAQGRLLLGDTWDSAHPIIIATGLATVAGGLFAGANTGIRAMQAARELLQARLVMVPVAFLGPLIGAWRWGLHGATWGITVSMWWGLLWWCRAYVQAVRAAPHRTS